MILDPVLTAALRHWGARGLPFNDEPATECFAWEPWTQTLELLHRTAALRSIMLLIGDNGVGKSTLASHWIGQLEPRAYTPLALTHSTLSGNGVLSVLLQKLGKPASFARSRNLVVLEQAFQELNGTTPVIVLDEGQLYPPGALEEVRLLLGLNLVRQPLFALVLLGDLYLQDTLRLQHHKALYSRIGAVRCLPPLDRAQIEPFLIHQLHQVGVDRPAFTPAAIDLLASASAGLLRQLNLLSRWAFLAAAQAKANQIEPHHVHDAIEQVPSAKDRLPHSTDPSHGTRYLRP
jgi:general secretion pathway protein A